MSAPKHRKRIARRDAIMRSKAPQQHHSADSSRSTLPEGCPARPQSKGAKTTAYPKRTALKTMSLTEVASIAADVIGERAKRKGKRTMCAVLFVSWLLKGESVTDAELRQQTGEDASRVVDIARNAFHIPIQTRFACTAQVAYAMYPDEIDRFLHPKRRAKQARNVRTLVERHKHRRMAYAAARLAHDLGHAVPEWAQTIVDAQIPDIRHGRSDYAA